MSTNQNKSILYKLNDFLFKGLVGLCWLPSPRFGKFAVPKMTLKMNACLFTAYGGPEVLKYAQVDKPTPKEDQLLVKIKNTTAFMGDCEVRRLEMPLGLGYLFRLGFGILKPKFPTILGQEFSGIVESCGAKVDKFKVGDEVFGTKEIPFGTYAEYACVDPKSTILKPDYLTFPEAAALPIGSAEAIHFLDLANIKPGTKVLVIGAGGSIGTYAVQYAKHLGAVVTGVDHPSKFDLLKQIGCSGTIDYTTTDITQVPEKFDVVYDGAAKSTVPIMKKCLTPDGKVVIGTPTWGQLIQSLYDSRVLIKFPDTHDGHLKTALELCKTGAMKPVIDPKRFKLEQMAEAHAYAESGLKRGSIVVDVFE